MSLKSIEEYENWQRTEEIDIKLTQKSEISLVMIKNILNIILKLI